MGNDDKLSLIIMRDASQVLRYRIPVIWLKLSACILVVLVLAAVGGSYAGFIYWNHHSDLVSTNNKLHLQLAEQSIQLERLQNIEEIIANSDPQEIGTLFSSVASQRQTAPQMVNLQDIFVAMDMQMAGVTNLQLQHAGDELRISFELNNLTDAVLAGSINIYLITREALVLEALGEGNQLGFRIQRFRHVETTLTIPPGVEPEALFAVRVVIQDQNDKQVFIQTYPLTVVLTS